MKTVYKYKLNEGQTTEIYLPAGYKILTVGMQNKDIYVWIEAYVGVNNIELLLLDYIVTDWEVKDENLGEYVGTVFDSDMYVWNVYKEV